MELHASFYKESECNLFASFERNTHIRTFECFNEQINFL